MNAFSLINGKEFHLNFFFIFLFSSSSSSQKSVQFLLVVVRLCEVAAPLKWRWKKKMKNWERITWIILKTEPKKERKIIRCSSHTQGRRRRNKTTHNQTNFDMVHSHEKRSNKYRRMKWDKREREKEREREIEKKKRKQKGVKHLTQHSGSVCSWKGRQQVVMVKRKLKSTENNTKSDYQLILLS